MLIKLSNPGGAVWVDPTQVVMVTGHPQGKFGACIISTSIGAVEVGGMAESIGAAIAEAQEREVSRRRAESEAFCAAQAKAMKREMRGDGEEWKEDQ